TGDHDIRPAGNRLHDRLDTDIGVSRHQAFTQSSHVLVGFLHMTASGSHTVEDIVAGHRGDPQAVKAELPCDVAHGGSGADRIGCSHVGDDAYTPGAAGWQHGPHPLVQQRIESCPGVTCTDLL